jgi:hypothetical protein
MYICMYVYIYIYVLYISSSFSSPFCPHEFRVSFPPLRPFAMVLLYLVSDMHTCNGIVVSSQKHLPAWIESWTFQH